MPTILCCDSCEFWARGPEVRRLFLRSRPTEWGVCRRYPRQFDGRGFSYPPQHEAEWCGEYQEDSEGVIIHIGASGR